MYSVSDAYKKAIKQVDGRNESVTGTIKLKNGTITTITGDKIQQGSLYIKTQCTDKDDFSIGSVNASELGISILTDDNRHSYNDSTIELRYGIETSSGVWEYIPLGIYSTTEATRTGYSLSLKALDNLIFLDEPIEGIGTNGTAYDLTAYCCEKCGVTFGMTQADIVKLPNGKETFAVSSESPIKTCRDLISYISQMLGCFTCCDRQGGLVYRTFKPTVVSNLSADQRWNTSVSDYSVSYNGISIPIGESTYVRVDKNKPTGATLELESNSLIQSFPQEQIEKILDNILAIVTKVEYTPMNCNYTGDPALDVGDFVTMSDGNINGTITAMLTSINWKHHNQSPYKAVGKDPKLKVTETQSQKKINSTANNSASNKEVIYHYENSRKLNISDRNDDIISIPFVAIKDTNPLFHASIVLKIYTGGTLEFTYMIDNSLYRVKVMQTVNEGYATVTLFLPLIKVKGGLGHKVEVLLRSDTATGYIDKEQLQAVVAGQGLSAESTKWDGTIKVISEFPTVDLNNAVTANFTARPSISTQTPTSKGVSADIESILLNNSISVNFDASFDMEFVIENHTYWFDTAHQTDYEYDDNYYFKLADNHIKIADNYIFDGIPQDVDSGFLQMAQIDSSKFEQITDIRIEVESQ